MTLTGPAPNRRVWPKQGYVPPSPEFSRNHPLGCLRPPRLRPGEPGRLDTAWAPVHRGRLDPQGGQGERRKRFRIEGFLLLSLKKLCRQ